MATGNKELKITGEEDWRADSDLRTLMDAEKIRRDPKRLAKAKALAKARMLEAAAVASSEPEDE